MSRPLIAVAGRIAAAGRVSRSEISFAGRVYLDAVLRAGGEPLTLTPRELTHKQAVELLSGFGALVLMGGADVDPHLYGQQRQHHVYGVNHEQDHFEIALVHAAIELKLPTLAVCRGIQLVNVALGGTLIQHIGDIDLGDKSGLVEHAPGKFPAGQEFALHDVEVTPRTKLSKALGATNVRVASFHHQGIDDVGKGLKVVAHSPDGLVEALEHSGSGQWLIGVQWHPEDTASTDAHQQSLYNALIAQTQ